MPRSCTHDRFHIRIPRDVNKKLKALLPFKGERSAFFVRQAMAFIAEKEKENESV